MKNIVFLESKKERFLNKVNKFNLEFLIQFENKTTFYYYCNIAIKCLFNLAFVEFRNLLIVFVVLDCINKIIDKYILLFWQLVLL